MPGFSGMVDYQYFFDKIELVSGRKGYILPEPQMFKWNDHSLEDRKLLVSQPDHSDYNATVAWLPLSRPPFLKPWRGHEQEEWKILMGIFSFK